MKNLNVTIATNLKKIREERKLSLDKLAELTDISKSMLGQIERGESNPSITTIWSIVNGLKIQFSALINKPQVDATIINKEDIQPLVEDSGNYRLYPIFPYNGNRHFEVYVLEIEKGGYSTSTAHVGGTQEFITVFEGEVTICINNEEYIVKKGNSIKFRADKPHSYLNSGDVITKLNMTLFYPL